MRPFVVEQPACASVRERFGAVRERIRPLRNDLAMDDRALAMGLTNAHSKKIENTSTRPRAAFDRVLGELPTEQLTQVSGDQREPAHDRRLIETLIDEHPARQRVITDGSRQTELHLQTQLVGNQAGAFGVGLFISWYQAVSEFDRQALAVVNSSSAARRGGHCRFPWYLSRL